MEELIKEYLLSNASKYAEFVGISPDFINNEESDEYKEYKQYAINFLEKGGLIPKYQLGTGLSGVTGANPDRNLEWSWRGDVFALLQLRLLDKLKLGLEGKEGGITMDEFNNYQKEHSRLYNLAKANNNDFYKTAYKDDAVGKLQKFYLDHGFNDLAIGPNWEKRYKVNSPNPTSGDRQGQWTVDSLYSGITDDRRFGRDGDWSNPEDLENFRKLLKELGYTYDYDDASLYYLLNRIKNPDSTTSESPEGLKSGLPTEGTISNKFNPLSVLRSAKNVIPDAIELAKFIESNNVNKKMRDLFLRWYDWEPLDHISPNRNIYDNLGELRQGYNQAANTESLAARLAANTADLRLANATRLEGNLKANLQRAEARLRNDSVIRDTMEKKLGITFDNLAKEQDIANENRARQVAANNVRLNNQLEFMNQHYANKKGFYDYWKQKYLMNDLDRREFASTMLTHLFNQAIQNDPTVKQAREAWEQDRSNTNWNNYIKARENAELQLSPTYYEQLAKSRGFTWKYSDNPFIKINKDGGKVTDDGPSKRRSKDLERWRKERRDWMHYNDKKLDRLGRLTYLYAKRAQGKK